VNLVERLYRILLRLYPPAFRRRYGWQMLEDFRELRRERRGWLVALVDVLRTAPREWLGAGDRERGPAGPGRTGPFERFTDSVRGLRRIVRGLARAPGYSLVVVATLAVGIGASTAVFSWTEGLVLRPLPAVADPARLFTLEVSAVDGQDDAAVLSWPDLVDVRDGLQPRARVAAFGFGRFRVTAPGEDADLPSPAAWGVFVSDDYFSVLGVRPLRGRFLSPSDAQAGASGHFAVISEALWTRRFGRDPRIVGRPLRIDGVEFQVVGVAPPDFAGTTVGLKLDVWLPVEASPEVWGDEGLIEDRDRRWLRALGRLDATTSRSGLGTEVDALWARIRVEHPVARELHASVVPLDIGVAGRLRPLLLILLGITGLMLLAICSNVANLTLLRGARHDHEVAVLLALGAERRRLAGRVLAESGVLAVLGVAAGVGVAWLGRGILGSLLPPSTLPLALDAPVDVRVLVFAAAMGTGTALLFGAAPALRALRAMPLGALRVSRSGSRGSAVQSTTLIVVQLALSLGTLVTAGFFVHRLDELAEVDRGFADPGSVVLFPAELTDADLQAAWEDGTFRRVSAEVRALRGVTSAAFTSFVPLGFEGYRYLTVSVPGDSGSPDSPTRLMVSLVGDGYFELMGIPIRSGRPLDVSDGREAPVAVVVNEAFVRAHMRGSDPLGRGLTIGGRNAVVVGVAADGKYRYDQLDDPSPPFVWLAWDQWDPAPLTVMVRTTGPRATTTADVRRAFATYLPDAFLLGPIGLDEYTSVALVPVRLGGTVLGGLGTLASVLAALGLYAIMAFRVTQRTREVGVRLAVGAGRAQVVGMFLRQGATTATVGLLLGLPVGFAIQKVFERSITGFEAGGPVVYAHAAGLLLSVALAAVALAAHKASQVPPAEALRGD
jgi:predicted permease